jgi:hypothetical protein
MRSEVLTTVKMSTNIDKKCKKKCLKHIKGGAHWNCSHRREDTIKTDLKFVFYIRELGSAGLG